VIRLSLFAAAVTTAAALFAACGARDTYDVHIDATFTPDERVQIVDALHEWQTVGASFPSIDVRPHEDAFTRPDESTFAGELWIVQSEPVNLSSEGTARACPEARAVGGKTGRAGVTYDVGANAIECLDTEYLRSTPGLLRTAVLHETGHALGLRFMGGDRFHYTGARPSVMHIGVDDDAPHLTCVDVAAFCGASGDCDLNEGDCK